MENGNWLMLALFSVAVWGIAQFIPRLLILKINALQMTIFHMIFFFLAAASAQAFYGFDVMPATTGAALLGVLIGLVGGGGQMFFLMSVEKGPFSQVAVICSLYPLVTTLLAVNLIGETLSMTQWGGVLLGLVSVAEIARRKTTGPERAHGRVWLASAFMSLVLWGIWGFLPKIALGSMPPHQVVFYESIGNLLIGLAIAARHKITVRPGPRIIALLAATSGLSVAAILAYFYALQRGPVSIIVTLTAMYPAISLLLARMILKEKITKDQALGIGFGLIAVLLLAS